VKKLNSSAARILIIGQVGFVLVHTTMYMIGLRFWNVVTPYYMLMYVLEEIPNAYNFLLCISASFDYLVPNNINGSEN